jgi:hypothetical protein
MAYRLGVIKTHKLYLNQPPVILAPTLPQQRASRVTVGPRAVRDLLDHFGRRADSQLQWMFSAEDVRVRSLERDADSQGASEEMCLEWWGLIDTRLQANTKSRQRYLCQRTSLIFTKCSSHLLVWPFTSAKLTYVPHVSVPSQK